MKGYFQAPHPKSQQNLEDLAKEAWQQIRINVIHCCHTRIYSIKHIPYLLKLGAISLIYVKKSEKK
jgi:hypothetical protein